MLFRQLLDLRSSTFTYLLGDEATGEAVIIDPVFEQVARDAALLRELGLKLRFTLETHVHADHVTGAWLLRQATGAAIAVSAAAGVDGADRLLEEGDAVPFGARALRALSTPGHTDGCMSYVLDDASMVFSGDSLMIRSAGRTDFQQGDARRLYRSVHAKLLSLPPACLVFPAHDYAGRCCTSVAEERAYNPRLGGARSEDDFVGYMDNLGLPHPKQIDVALPANLACGRPPAGAAAPSEWAPALRTFGGILEVAPEWLAEHRAEVTVLDVREPAEWDGELGHIAGAVPLPLGQLRERLGGLPGDRPIVTVCRSGARSAQAQQILEKAGLHPVANLDGGMLRWRSLGLRD